MKKRKKILILLIIFFLTSTFYPHDLKNKFFYKFKFFNLETINIQSNQSIYDNMVKSKLKNYYGQNLLFLEKENEPPIEAETLCHIIESGAYHTT